jgi:hypothetical protein
MLRTVLLALALLSTLWAASHAAGNQLDPNGAAVTTDAGGHADPNGAAVTGDAGNHADPNG